MESFLLDLFSSDAGGGGGDAARAPAMDAAAPRRRTAPLLVARFPDAATANRRLGGLSLAARWAARAREAGQALAIFAPGLSRWPAVTRDDFARVGLEPAIVTTVEPGATVLDARYLPDPAALRAAVRGAPVDHAAVIDLADERMAIRRLVVATAKPSDGVVSRWLNRPVSQRITAMLLRYAPFVRPSHVTGVVGTVALVMALSLLSGTATGLVAGGILFHVASVLDGVDGELARVSYRSSPEGAVLDTRVDLLTNIGFFVCTAVALTRLYGGLQAAVGGMAVMLALLGLGIVTWLAKRRGAHGSLDVLKPYYRERFPDGWQYWVTEALVAATSRDFFAFAFAMVIVLGYGWTVSWLLLGFVSTWLAAVVCAMPGVLRQAELQTLRGI